MKRKNFCWLTAVCLIVMCFVSCGEKAKINDFGFYEDLDDAKEAAKKQKKDIILFVSMEGYDDESKSFREQVLSTDDIKTLLGDKFVFTYFDFGEDAYAYTEVKPGATKEEQTAAEEKLALIMKNMQFARTLNIQYTPVAFILTSEGYYIARLDYSENFESPSKFANEVNEFGDDLAEMKSLIEATKKGSVSDRMNAINSIYEKMGDTDRGTYSDVFRQASEIDKKNETGLVSKLYMEAVLADCMAFYSVGDYGSAIQVLTAGAQSGKLDGAEKQEAYYMAGYLLVTAGSEDIDTILGYFNLAIQAYPDGEFVTGIQEIINTIASMFAAQEETGEN